MRDPTRHTAPGHNLVEHERPNHASWTDPLKQNKQLWNFLEETSDWCVKGAFAKNTLSENSMGSAQTDTWQCVCVYGSPLFLGFQDRLGDELSLNTIYCFLILVHYYPTCGTGKSTRDSNTHCVFTCDNSGGGGGSIITPSIFLTNELWPGPDILLRKRRGSKLFSPCLLPMPCLPHTNRVTYHTQ